MNRRCYRHGSFEADDRKSPCPICTRVAERLDAAFRAASKADLIEFIRKMRLLDESDALHLEDITHGRKSEALLEEHRKLTETLRRVSGMEFLDTMKRATAIDRKMERLHQAWMKRHGLKPANS